MLIAIPPPRLPPYHLRFEEVGENIISRKCTCSMEVLVLLSAVPLGALSHVNTYTSTYFRQVLRFRPVIPGVTWTAIQWMDSKDRSPGFRGGVVHWKGREIRMQWKEDADVVLQADSDQRILSGLRVLHGGWSIQVVLIDAHSRQGLRSTWKSRICCVHAVLYRSFVQHGEVLQILSQNCFSRAYQGKDTLALNTSR